MKFTDPTIRSLKRQAKRYIAWKDNGEGLGVRVSPQGKKSFIFMYRFEGRNRMMTLGEHPANKLADINVLHAEALKKLASNIDPGVELIEQKQADRDAYTVADLKDEYIEKWAKPRKRSWEEDDRILKKDVLPEWRHRKAKNIKRSDIINKLDEIVNRGAGIQANRTLAVIRKMFNFAVSRDIIPYSPCVGVSAPSAENRRDRVLNDEEIKKLWENLENTDMQVATRLAVKLILTTAQRAGEVVGMEWRELDMKNGWWTISGQKSKNKLPHRVPLSPLALSLLKLAQQYSGASAFVFPSPRAQVGRRLKRKLRDKYIIAQEAKRKDRPIAEIALAHAMHRNLEAKLVMQDLTPHDLRRTAASAMTSMGISRLVVSKILNHAESGVTAVYDRHSYDAEKRKALNLWGKKLAVILK